VLLSNIKYRLTLSDWQDDEHALSVRKLDAKCQIVPRQHHIKMQLGVCSNFEFQLTPLIGPSQMTTVM
jgi:hypothetical protein